MLLIEPYKKLTADVWLLKCLIIALPSFRELRIIADDSLKEPVVIRLSKQLVIKKNGMQYISL